MSKLLLRNKSLILVGGYPGSGKSVIARKMARTFACVYLDKDEMQDVFSTFRLDKKIKATKPFVYSVIYKIAENNLALNTSVLIDAPFSLKRYMPNKQWVLFMKKLAKANGARIKVVWCIARNETRKKRILRRAADRDKERFPELDEFIAGDIYFDKTHKFPIPFPHLIFDTEKDSFSAIVKFLK